MTRTSATLNGATISELRQRAKERGIDLKGITKKADILKALGASSPAPKTKKSKKGNEKPKKSTLSMKKSKKQTSRPKLFENVPRDRKKFISLKGWKWLEDQIWEVLWRLVRLKMSTGIVPGEFSLETCLNGISNVSDNSHFITHLKEVEIWDYIQAKIGRPDIDYGFIIIGAYIEGILDNIIFEALGDTSLEHDGPATVEDLKMIPGSEILEWAIIFGHPYAITKMTEETKRMAPGDAIDAFAIGSSVLRNFYAFPKES